MKIKNMTKREALVGCIDMWELIARKGISKVEALQEILGVDYQEGDLEADCFACQFAKGVWVLGRQMCDACPIWTHANNCCSPGSPFMEWLVTDSRLAAQAVADLAAEKLKALDEAEVKE